MAVTVQPAGAVSVAGRYSSDVDPGFGSVGVAVNVEPGGAAGRRVQRERLLDNDRRRCRLCR